MSAAHAGAVGVEFPADTVNMVIARTVAATMAARADLTVDQVEDVRLAMDEATAHMIKVALPDSRVVCEMWTEGSTVHALLSCTIGTAVPADPDPFAWTVLTALVDSVGLETHGESLQLRWSLASDHSLRA